MEDADNWFIESFDQPDYSVAVFCFSAICVMDNPPDLSLVFGLFCLFKFNVTEKWKKSIRPYLYFEFPFRPIFNDISSILPVGTDNHVGDWTRANGRHIIQAAIEINKFVGFILITILS